jgi:hypothetical protein
MLPSGIKYVTVGNSNFEACRGGDFNAGPLEADGAKRRENAAS